MQNKFLQGWRISMKPFAFSRITNNMAHGWTWRRTLEVEKRNSMTGLVRKRVLKSLYTSPPPHNTPSVQQRRLKKDATLPCTAKCAMSDHPWWRDIWGKDLMKVVVFFTYTTHFQWAFLCFETVGHNPFSMAFYSLKLWVTTQFQWPSTLWNCGSQPIFNGLLLSETVGLKHCHNRPVFNWNGY